MQAAHGSNAADHAAVRSEGEEPRGSLGFIESHQGCVAKAKLSDLILDRRVIIPAGSRSGA